MQLAGKAYGITYGGIVVGATSTILRWLRRAGLTRKELRAAEQDRPDVAKERRRWRAWQRYMDPARFVFLDETGTSTNMVRRYGRCERGARRSTPRPGDWKTTTFVAGLRASGVVAPRPRRTDDGRVVQGLRGADAGAGPLARRRGVTSGPQGGRRARGTPGVGSVLCISRPTARTSTRSSSSSPSSKPCSGQPPGPRTRSGPPSAKPSTPSPKPNARTTSPTPATSSPKSNPL